MSITEENVMNPKHWISGNITEENIVVEIAKALLKFQDYTNEKLSWDIKLTDNFEWDDILDKWLSYDVKLLDIFQKVEKVNGNVSILIQDEIDKKNGKEVVDNDFVTSILVKSKVRINYQYNSKIYFSVKVGNINYRDINSDLKNNPYHSLLHVANYCGYDIDEEKVNKATLVDLLQKSIYFK